MIASLLARCDNTFFQGKAIYIVSVVACYYRARMMECEENCLFCLFCFVAFLHAFRVKAVRGMIIFIILYSALALMLFPLYLYQSQLKQFTNFNLIKRLLLQTKLRRCFSCCKAMQRYFQMMPNLIAL